MQCSDCHGYYTVEEISNYNVKRLRADQAILQLVEISNMTGADPREYKEE